jgi:hypothetical protein
MNKFLITLATLVAFSLNGVAFADAKVSGYLWHMIGAGDDIDGGITQKFSRFSFGADTTTDNGWTVGGSMAIEYSTYNDPSKSGYLPSSNSMYVQTDMATISIGSTADATTGLIPRISAMVPGAGTDGGFPMLFDGGHLSGNGVEFAEAYYADANSKIHVALPSVNGFTVGLSYTPSNEYGTKSNILRRGSDVDGSHSDVVNVAASYSGEMDGMTYTVAVSSISGNSQGSNGRSGTQANNNDLSSFTAGMKLGMGNITVGAHMYDNGASFGSSTDADKASEAGYNVAATYAMGNITIGVGMSHSELARGTNAQARATTLTAAAASNVREDTAVQVGIGYDLGGGVNTFLQLTNYTHSDGDHATNEADPQILIGGISLGF